ncbi:hypothetical protein [Tateyamaria sp. SN3-11]|uniref:hypothetical protein n=1 Tax=Tateyamaria sp. SN3-11 TaxID=3092147 RepID=UPI0039EBE576
MKLPLYVGFAAFLASGSLAQAACPAAQGVDIYPTAKVLPENLLRIYVYYPRSMSADVGLQHVRLLKSDGAAIDGVFLTNRADLWSPDRRRLTLLLDPGRVKTGLVANENLGRALVAGKSYILDVSGAALDTTGCSLGIDTQHSFVVENADTAPPDPAHWAIVVPRAHSTDALHVDLGSAHDHLSMAFRLRVLDKDGNTVLGAIALGPEEELWEFTPRAAWTAARYTLAIDERLEDLAGNRPGRLFDRPSNQAPSPWMQSLGFTPKAQVKP